MKTIQVLSVIILATLALTFSSCNKDAGFVGKGKISGMVTYPDGALAGAVVSISFGATAQTTTVDYTTTSDASGNYSFIGLNKGDYYVTASFTDSHGYVFTTGGAHVKLNSPKSEATADLVLQ